MGTKYFSTGHKTTGNFSYSIQGHCVYTGDSGGRTSNTITSTIYAAVTLRSRAKKVDKTVSVSLGGSGWKTALSWHENKTGQGGVAAQSKRGTAHPSETLSNTDTTVTLYAKATGGTSGTFGKTKIDSVTVPKMKQYTIKYQRGDGATGGSVDNQTMYHGGSVSLRKNKYTKQGFHFDHWRDITHDKNYNAGATYSKNSNATMEPRFEENTYSVVYNGNQGNGSTIVTTKDGFNPKQSSLKYNTTYHYINWMGFERVGYDPINAWFTKATGGAQKSLGGSFSRLTDQNGGIYDMFVHWTPKTYTLTYNANRTKTYPFKNNGAAAFTDNNQTKTISITFDSYFNYIAASNLKPLQRYDFVAWTDNSDGGGSSYTAGLSQRWTTPNNRTVYAKWKDLYKEPHF